MAEPTKFYARKLVEVFLKYYNLANKTAFAWDEKRSYQPQDRPYIDFIVFDKKTELAIQHSRATADPIREFVKPRAADKVVDPLKKMLEENKSLPNLSIYINFFNPPKNKEDTNELVYWLDYFISSKVTSSLGVGFFNYDSSFDDQFLPRILKNIDHIDIQPYYKNVKERVISITYGWSEKVPQPWMDDAQRVLKAIEKKKNLAKDTLLLIESGWSGIHPIYRQIIEKELSKESLKEVWIVEIMNEGTAFRVK